MQVYFDGTRRRYLDRDLDLSVFGDRVVHYFAEDDIIELEKIEGSEPIIEGIKRHGRIALTKI